MTNLQHLRESAHLSQAYVCGALGIKIDELNTWEKEGKCPPLYMPTLAELYVVPINSLTGQYVPLTAVQQDELVISKLVATQQQTIKTDNKIMSTKVGKL